MILALVAAIGVGLAGYGIFKGGSDVGEAAKEAAGATDRAGRAAEQIAWSFDEFRKEAEQTLKKISSEVTEIRVFITSTVWPEVNKTMADVRKVLDSANVLLVSSNFTVKVLALLLAICAAYMTSKLITSRNFTLRRQRGKRNNVSSAIENLILAVLYWLCIGLALGLVLHLANELLNIFLPDMKRRIKELLNIWWPDSIPRIVIIFILSLAFLYEKLIITVQAFLMLVRLILYIVIEVPINMGLDPVKKGSRYMEMINGPLQLIMCFIYLALYSFIPYGAFCLMEYLTYSEKSTKWRIFIRYGVFYSATIATWLLGDLIISSFIRPIWAFWARRNLNRNKR